MNNSNDLQQTLLELHYGLLDETEATQWRQRIASDAEVALAWADVLKLSDQFSKAARGGWETESGRSRTRESSVYENSPAPEVSRLRLLADASGYIRWPRMLGISLATVAMLFVAAVIGTRFVERAPGRLIVPGYIAKLSSNGFLAN